MISTIMSIFIFNTILLVTVVGVTIGIIWIIINFIKILLSMSYY